MNLPHADVMASTPSEAVEPFRTPILLIVFNRPETTKAVFESIRSMRPTELYIAADGPRHEVEGEQARCRQARQIATAVDWSCSVRTLFRDRNLGCAASVSSAISWFFENVEEGIILEDDCVPGNSFYRYCRELLEHYRYRDEVMHIAGDNFQYGRKRGDASYYFSKYPFIWGWASWRRAWRHYDFKAADVAVQSTTWDAQWVLALEKQHGVSVVPNANLVTNIGFGPGATHTTTVERFAGLPAEEIDFPLRHPEKVRINREADRLTYYANFRNIPNLRMVWAYRAWDFLYLRLKRLKRWIFNRESLW